jgi:hypothetical protein
LPVILVVATLAGCDGGPGFATRVEAVNGCDVDLAVVAQNLPEPSPYDTTTSAAVAILADNSGVFAVADRREVGGDVAYIWVVPVGAPNWGEPTEFSVDALAEVTLPDGSTARRLTIEGDLCP